MGFINKILPKPLKPISRDIGFTVRSLLYIIKSVNSRINKNPNFILGNQKSGTTVIASLLGELSNKKSSIDLFYSGFRYKNFLNWKKEKISTKQFINLNKLDFSAEIIKEPHLTVFYNELKKYYPKSKFVFIVRNPIDNIRSILDRLNIKGNQLSLNNNDKNNIFHSWKLVFDNSWVGQENNNYIENLASRWNLLFNIYKENNDNIILIKYEDFSNNKLDCIKKLAKKLELNELNEINHLLNKQFQSKGKNKNQDMLSFFGKENYNIILKICGDNMRHLGYL
jgi:hypothetical protein|tara:strand:+ start:7827 stop:8672 length:846 start_codon:yes stop_codon:yes gene_type:complete